MVCWNNPIKRLPQPNQVVWVVLKHWKRDTAQNLEIYAGVVCQNIDGTFYVWNNDEIGQGNQIWEFPDLERGFDTNKIYAWAAVDSITVPKWK